MLRRALPGVLLLLAPSYGQIVGVRACVHPDVMFWFSSCIEGPGEICCGLALPSELTSFTIWFADTDYSREMLNTNLPGPWTAAWCGSPPLEVQNGLLCHPCVVPATEPKPGSECESWGEQGPLFCHGGRKHGVSFCTGLFDFDRDGDRDMHDFAYLQNHWGELTGR